MEANSIIGNDSALAAVSAMIDGGRTPHSLVIYGEKGLGKKTLAAYIAAKLLCRSPANTPCGVCKSCRAVFGGGHPDFIRVIPSLKSGAYKLEDLRQVVSDCAVAPNESSVKVYLIADMDKTPLGSQNALLKLIEEPPDHAVIIMTASARECFLPTVLSRVISVGMVPVSRSQCERYLVEALHKSPEQAHNAAEAMGGNIGRCEEFLNGGRLAAAAETAISVAGAITSGSEYELLRAFWSCDGDREQALLVLKLLREILRDAAVIRLGDRNNLLGCSQKCAEALAESLSGRKLAALVGIPERYISAINGNANLTLCLSAVCADIKSIV